MELWFTERHTPYVNFSIKVERQLYTAQSEFQRIDVFESREFGRFLTLDGYMMLTEKDEFIYHEMITHIPMAVHPNPENILVIGAGDGGVLPVSPDYGVIMRNCENSILKENAMHNGSLKNNLIEESNTGCIIADNVGCLYSGD